MSGREFWLVAHHNDPDTFNFVMNTSDCGGIHVIEKSAYDELERSWKVAYDNLMNENDKIKADLQRENERLKAHLEHLQVMAKPVVDGWLSDQGISNEEFANLEHAVVVTGGTKE